MLLVHGERVNLQLRTCLRRCRRRVSPAWIGLLLGLALMSLMPRVYAAQDRVAFVVGNADYPQPQALRNPTKDATDVGRLLETAGFETRTYLNLKRSQVPALQADIAGRIRRDSVVFIYYAGHGVQVDGRNYLVPVDAPLESSTQLTSQSLYLGDLLLAIERARPKLAVVVLDACRDNPFVQAKGLSIQPKGLARVDPPTSTVVFYATRPGGVAQDGTGDNGVFTEALLREMRKPGQPLEVIFRKVSTSVFQATRSEQEPWIEGVIREEFVVNPWTATNVQTALAPAAPEPTLASSTIGAHTPSNEVEGFTREHALAKLRDLPSRIMDEAATAFSCDATQCEDYRTWMRRYDTLAVQGEIENFRRAVLKSSVAKMCEYSLTEKRCLSQDVRFPFVGSNLIVANAVYADGFSLASAIVSKSGGISFQANLQGGAVFYTGYKTRSRCETSEGRMAFEREKVVLELARFSCRNTFTVSANKTRIDVLLLDHGRQELIAEMDFSFFGAGFGVATGGGKRVVKIGFQ